MKGLILVNAYTRSDHELYQPRRLCEELVSLGVEAVIRRNCDSPAYLDNGVRTMVGQYDFCVYLDKDRYVPRLLEKAGMRLFNSAAAVETCDDKMLTHIALAGVAPMPKTLSAPLCYVRGEPVHRDLIARVEQELGYPVVVKQCFGSLGKGVSLAENRTELELAAKALQEKPHLFQQYVAESRGRDLRVLVVGKKAVAAMRRVSDTDFRSNAELGGRGESCELDTAASELCERVAKTLDLDYCGVDLLFGKDGYLVCEVNSNAFFGTFERVTKINVARLYARYIVDTMQNS